MFTKTMLFAAAAICGPAAPVAAQTFVEQGTSLIGATTHDARSVSLADIDNDGDLDALLQGAVSARRLFRNDYSGPGTLAFTDITATHGPSAPDTTGWSAAWGDYDGDGDVDVFLGETNNSGARGDLFRNDGASGFTDVSSTTINDPGFHQNVAWCDIDNDLDLDLIIAQEGPEKHQIYIQNGDGTFTAVGAASNFQQDYGTKAYGMAIGDPDDDGDFDIYISTCIAGGNIRNNFYENQIVPSTTLTLTDIADSNGTQYLDNSYGSEFHDFDDDGDLDLMMTGADGERTKIWRNEGSGLWTDVDTITDHPLLSNQGMDLNGGHAIDYDNDSDLDLYFHDQRATVTTNTARLLYRNDGNWQFTDVTNAESLESTNEGAYDSSWGDLDLDGDLDLFFANDTNYPERIFISNTSTNGNNWLYVRLAANAPNTRAIGAQVYATIHQGTPSEKILRRDANTNPGTFAQNDLPVHFGLGTATQVDELRIKWPDGSETTLTDIASNQYYSAIQPASSIGTEWNKFE